jgi:hypothetical protein
MPTAAAATALLAEQRNIYQYDSDGGEPITPDVNSDQHPGPVRREGPQGNKKARKGTADPDAATVEFMSRSMEGTVSVLQQRNELERERLLYEMSRDEHSLLQADIDVFQALYRDQVTLSRENQDCRAEVL